MIYTEKKPKNELSQFIECIWISDFKNDCKKMQATVADGYTEIVFKFVEADKGFNLEHLEQKYVIGEKTVFKKFEIDKDNLFIGIKFKPGFLFPLLNIFSMHEITDKSVMLDSMNSQIFKNFKGFDDQQGFLSQIQRFLFKAYEKNNKHYNPVENAVNMIISSNGSIDLMELSRESCMHIRNLERKFNHYVGISPKKLCRLIRFNNTRRKMLSTGNLNFVELALSAGYSDQAHFNHDFREFAGINPTCDFNEVETFMEL